jgi:hypothetical protein
VLQVLVSAGINLLACSSRQFEGRAPGALAQNLGARSSGSRRKML